MAVTIKTRKLRVNKLLSRKELLLDIYHEGEANVSQKKLKDLVADKFRGEAKNIVVFGLRTAFGGNRTTGFALIYETQNYLVKYEPNYRLRRLAILPKRNPQRKPKKELKRKIKKSRGSEKRKVLATRKTETPAMIRRAKEEYLKKLIG